MGSKALLSAARSCEIKPREGPVGLMFLGRPRTLVSRRSAQNFFFPAVDPVPRDHPPGADHVEDDFGRAGLSPRGPQRGSEGGAAEAAAGPGADCAWAADR